MRTWRATCIGAVRMGARTAMRRGACAPPARFWHEKGEVRKNVLDLFAKDVKKFSGDPRRVLFCFLSDPYQALEGKEHVTRQAIQLAQAHHVKVDILTKGYKELILADLPLMSSSFNTSSVAEAVSFSVGAIQFIMFLR